MNPPSGCFFHPRCRYCMDICKSEAPEMKSYIIDGKEHFVACHLSSKRIQEEGNYEQARTI